MVLEMVVFRFRPLDGESFSKRMFLQYMVGFVSRFRPLDGESFSKR